MAKGYWICLYEEISDPEKYAEYGPLARPAISALGGTALVLGGECIASEGLPASRTVIIEFDSFEQAQKAYDDPSYVAAREKLEGAAKRILRIVEGA